MSHNDQNFSQRIREMGYRLTPQRQLILDTLCDLGGHATIAQLYDQIHAKSPAIDRATVYRSINLFEKIQFVVSAEINGTTVYEISNPERHHHLVCRECGSSTELADHHFAALSQHILEEHNFMTDMNHLTISGICHACQ